MNSFYHRGNIELSNEEKNNLYRISYISLKQKEMRNLELSDLK
ncbi:hypothetical protein DFR55_102123 [Herbinix hemicellulosilytica]|uniref:Uncharacterized protein n=1 Tax=Herbinix hemicellulosilytica TaxID=1564487 RepID=A0A0H5SET2_HERHM|nr:hypothetical protein [Herbinix hemicellulosilytica]RBP60328.1 hypothetical protein DFR55_102123 [Herbinix hemicellulosilytica]CRZ33530.1 hypothetical protein HHT355_0320 [Herbinix hemicellulosilytica]